MKKLLRKKAFTLVELIVAMAIMMVLIGAAMAMFTPVSSIIKSLDEDAVTNSVTDTIMGYISDKLNVATSYNIAGFTDEQMTKSSDEDDSVGKRVKAMLADLEANEKMYCMVLRSTAKGYKLHDLGRINSLVNYNTKAAVAVSDDFYSVFGDEYYNDSRYKFTFDTTVADKGTWCRIGVNTYDADGNIKISERVQMFKLLNMSLLKLTPSSDTALKDYSYSEDLNVVILYRIKTFG
ncbi:MAG: type II secretion system protein [Ruminiclostridium sp.]